MKRFAATIALGFAFAAPASAFTVDLTLPTLTFPEPTETMQSCIQPAQIGAPDCPVAE